MICTYWDLGLLERRHQNQCRFAPHWARPFRLSYTPQWNKCCTRTMSCTHVHTTAHTQRRTATCTHTHAPRNPEPQAGPRARPLCASRCMGGCTRRPVCAPAARHAARAPVFAAAGARVCNGACRLYSVCMRRVYIVRADPFSSAGLHLRRLSANRILTCHCHVVQASPFSCAGLHKRRLSAHRILTCRYVLWQCYLLTVVLYLLAMVR